MRYGLINRCWLLSGSTVLLLGCTQTPSSPTAPSAFASRSEPTLSSSSSQSSERCMNVSLDITHDLGLVLVSAGVGALGVVIPVTLGSIPGVVNTAVISNETNGVKAPGTRQLKVQLSFTSSDPKRAGTLLAEYKAVCASADPNVCKVNDTMQIVSGSEVFSHPGGSLRSHGVIDYNNNTMDVRVRGRVCGDGPLM